MGIEGLIVLFIIGFVLDQMSKAAKRRAAAERARQGAASPSEAVEDEGAEAEAAPEFSLRSVLQEIERVNREAKARAQERVTPPPRLEPKRPAPAGPTPRVSPRGRMAPPPRKPYPQTERGPSGRRGRMELASAEEVEERTSLEVEPEIRTFDETARERPEREVIDLDEGAEEVVQRRIAAAEARNREHRAVDHADFHRRIEPQQALATVRGLTPAQLRSAFIWREVLGPPGGIAGESEWR